MILVFGIIINFELVFKFHLICTDITGLTRMNMQFCSQLLIFYERKFLIINSTEEQTNFQRFIASELIQLPEGNQVTTSSHFDTRSDNRLIRVGMGENNRNGIRTNQFPTIETIRENPKNI